MKDKEIKRLNGAIIGLISEFEKSHGVLIDYVRVGVSGSVSGGIVCRIFSIETSYNEKE